MRLPLCRTLALLAVCVLTGAASADVMVSQSNSPTLALGAEFRSLLEEDDRNRIPKWNVVF